MAASEVYSSTTAPNPKSSWFTVPSENLDSVRFVVKVFEVLLSFVAFILEEVITSCISCVPLYFFEFISCTAFLFTLLLLVLLATSLSLRVGISCWPSLDFLYTAVIALLFLISSITFAKVNRNSDVEKSAMAFGFMASFLFTIDLVLFLKTRGFPFKSGGKLESSNGGPLAGAVPPETEKLHTPSGGPEQA